MLFITQLTPIIVTLFIELTCNYIVVLYINVISLASIKKKKKNVISLALNCIMIWKRYMHAPFLRPKVLYHHRSTSLDDLFFYTLSCGKL